MSDGITQELRHRGLQLNERIAAWLDNGFEWLFMRGFLVQSGSTPYETLIDGDPMSLRYYPLPESASIELADGARMAVRRQRHPVPLLLVPPLGVTTEVFDLLPQRSLVRYMAARGFHTYLVDWGRPERRHAQLSLRDYAVDMLGQAIAEVRRHSGAQPVSVMGWCMGGLLALMHAGATRDRNIRNLITVASPIDMRSSGVMAQAARVLNASARLIRRFTSFRLDRLDPAHLQAPGWTTTLAFKLTAPLASLTPYWDLLTRLADRDYLEVHATTSDYLDNMLMYPAGVVRDMLVRVVVDNRLAEGSIPLGDIHADLSAVRAKLLVYAGETDHLVPAQMAQKSLELVGSKDKTFRIAPGGHMGVILGGRAQREVWEPCAQWLDARSELSRRSARPSAADETQRRVRARRLADDVTL
ncbi:alpha/beta fold hydrolase [Fontimonas sp. SYSU GA230001]|uniref:alpha/beta fold hydrolase n=1 Tax=Fontimonas sp. SYSU GA230001 TaxID=3142450 RepID=UPI0032B32DA3